jgi:WXG100 family type VII secretion target
MDAAAARMDQAKSNINRERTEVEASITRLFGSFTGAAASTYRTALNGWFQNVETINQTLQGLATSMRDGSQLVAAGAQNADSEAQDGHTRIAAPLPGL